MCHHGQFCTPSLISLPPPNLNWAQMQGDCESICDQRKSCYGGFTHHLEKALDAEDVSKEIVGHHVELLLGARGFEAVHLCERTRNGEQARGTAIQKHTPGCVHAKMYMCSASYESEVHDKSSRGAFIDRL